MPGISFSSTLLLRTAFKPPRRRADALRGGGFWPGPPLCVAEIEGEVGVAAVALQGLLKPGGGRRWIVAPILRGAQIVVDLVQRHGGRQRLEGLLRARKIAGLVAAQAKEELGLQVVRVGVRDAFEPSGGDLVLFLLPV